MALIEKKCSVCRKFSWDSDAGSYNETHVVKRNGKNVTENCNTNGEKYVNGVLSTD